MPLMPMPPIPTKWMGPISRGNLMRIPLFRAVLLKTWMAGTRRNPPIPLSFRGDAAASNPESRDSGFASTRRPGMTGLDSRRLHHQVGEPLGGVKAADAAGGGG